ncbi:ABC transporter permease [Bdellovibrio sp. HCB337]|uniref:ABC transporter permease n=1 Tax=Bdellovibrio sp. HCB337 TaxID=3394358 RepID=UPI0039A4FCF5
MKRRTLAVPTLIWFLTFVFVPLLIVFAVSLAARETYGGFRWSFVFENYQKSLYDTYLKILLSSVWLASITTLGCAMLGTLMAWAMATAKPSMRYFYVCAVALPFLTNLIIRVYAIRLFVGYEGPLQSLLSSLGFVFDPYSFSQNQFLVFYGMITTYLPFMVLPLYGAFEKFDFSLIEAAQDLGAGPWEILFSVILPNLKKALLSGSLLVFIPCLGEYVIPDLLGGAKNMLFGNMIAEKFLKSRDWPMGSALSIILILILIFVTFVFSRIQKGKKNAR